MMSEILTPEQVQECSDYYFVSPLARSHEALRAERDRLAAEVERLRVAARDFLDHHSLDCGAHYCRYCPARSPEWDHESDCAYVRSQSAYTALSAVLAEVPTPAREEGQ